MSKRFEGRTATITAASRGIGLGIAAHWAVRIRIAFEAFAEMGSVVSVHWIQGVQRAGAPEHGGAISSSPEMSSVHTGPGIANAAPNPPSSCSP